MPNPISSTRGARRPNTRSKSSGAGANGDAERGPQRVERALLRGRHPSLRSTKLRIGRCGRSAGVVGSGRRARWVTASGASREPSRCRRAGASSARRRCRRPRRVYSIAIVSASFHVATASDHGRAGRHDELLAHAVARDAPHRELVRASPLAEVRGHEPLRGRARASDRRAARSCGRSRAAAA